MAADDDDLPKNRKVPLRDLAPLGIAELEDYATELEVEIARTRREIAGKRSHRSGAEGLFKR